MGKLASQMIERVRGRLMEKILGQEEEHVDWLEAQLEQIVQTGLENYLAGQIG